MIGHLRIRGYRSIRALDLPLSPLTVILGRNGVGKTNLYRGLELVQMAASGRLATSLAAEGGMPLALWAGDGQHAGEDATEKARAMRSGPRRIELSVDIDHLRYDIAIGMPNRISDPALPLDPVIREERISARAGGRRVTMLERKGPALSLRDGDGRMQSFASDLLMGETALAMGLPPEARPEALALQNEIRGWRFYHQFRADPASPLRQPQFALCAPSLDSDGGNWIATLMTQADLGEPYPIDRAVDAAFPGSRLTITSDGTRAELSLQMPEFHRPFSALELSDGMLRYLCLVAALTAYRLPPVIVLNEPETSLHSGLIGPLAALIAEASERSQIILVTHSPELAERLDLDCAADVLRLVKDRGETRLDI
ncbi:AAA family ATPase [Oceanomicrobium pacificus]|uniref:AAA family ATPase n=1 Tax=Oceanomicrobium pacificus TaxID=2692916 RepID=A0A6B0TTZ0_9RHOB|nr:AAA family ATPase [Oceanomicrobium pacificus]MXU64702.1 AAA family ATPase [Oceanomicrobium pacificus]